VEQLCAVNIWHSALFIVGLFYDAVCSSDYRLLVSNDRLINK
jgi:hypothetical protein